MPHAPFIFQNLPKLLISKSTPYTPNQTHVNRQPRLKNKI